MPAFENGSRPILSFLTSHWLSLSGAVVTTVAGTTWLVTLPTQIRGHATNPYIGILLFLILPIVFIVGLALIPLGAWLARRAANRDQRLYPTRATSIKRLVGFLIVATVVNLVVMSQLSYRAVEYMEGTQFCGQACHIMKPQFTAHRVSPHARVLCVECHVGSGASGWLKSKISGTRQLLEVILDRNPRPVRSAIETNRLVPAVETCEMCHWNEKANGSVLRVIPEYAEDENNTRLETVLMMMVGGGGTKGIHGAHFGPGVSIQYASTDATRQTIPWVEYRNTNENVSRVYTTPDFTAEQAVARHRMECIDCHNRPAHTFQLPEGAVNNAMALGRIPVSLPFIRKRSVAVLRASYASNEEAAQKIPAALRDYYSESNSAIAPAQQAEIELAAKTLVAIYNENVFPDLKVTWGTYTNNLGHTTSAGCFRCHDVAHISQDQKEITQDCGVCHQIVAASEATPEVLNTLGLRERIANLQKRDERH